MPSFVFHHHSSATLYHVDLSHGGPLHVSLPRLLDHETVGGQLKNIVQSKERGSRKFDNKNSRDKKFKRSSCKVKANNIPEFVQEIVIT